MLECEAINHCPRGKIFFGRLSVQSLPILISLFSSRYLYKMVAHNMLCTYEEELEICDQMQHIKLPTSLHICAPISKSSSNRITKRLLQGVKQCHESGELIFYDEFDEIDFDVWDHEEYGLWTQTMMFHKLIFECLLEIIFKLYVVIFRACIIHALGLFYYILFIGHTSIACP